MDLALVVPAFIAGLLTFLAPCTLPLVPGYLGFVSGVSSQDLRDPDKSKSSRKKVFLNGLLFVIGFSFVFILLGSLFGLGGAVLIKYRLWLSRIGGIFVIFFGLFMIGIFKLPFLNVEKRIGGVKFLKPGNPVSSLIFGATFGFGWTPCVGPILGSILTLAAASATVFKGGFLLGVFSLGLALPFLVIALLIGSASFYISKITKYLNVISVVGGVFLIFLGILLVTDGFGLWITFFYKIFEFLDYDRLLDYL
ncbi:MAG: cytochrome C biogenesis protein [Candidatus Harrisonbacteria bacterium CG10_big_fil_rev_8_21_14_0_10_40_38]|uniref:Cytochrome C biogenesis protein n=1 Tax=Candidatus Harrisonbacteria bacterium CG10_big_fil_rev_8_21_14_0_10_40_38 TaxID=1974583 RepID=A0A2H0USU4_9BACT|nr:MAG: cytochrome C biogenesis protein [Candidatus Harrisonbacteria bacterium CG10_big_fil_rev_8_21_14_0_10_40_38]